MDPRDRLRLRLAGSACASCGHAYRGDDVRVLAQRDEVAFIRFRCSRCRVERLVLWADETADDDGERSAEFACGEFSARDEARFRGRAPVDEDDVRAARAFLDGYAGDARRLVDRPRIDARGGRRDDHGHGWSGRGAAGR